MTENWMLSIANFHVDRSASALDQTWDKTLGTLSPFRPNIPVKHQVNLVGGVMVFCDPDKYHRLPVMYPKFTSAIGVHPKEGPTIHGQARGTAEVTIEGQICPCPR